MTRCVVVRRWQVQPLIEITTHPPVWHNPLVMSPLVAYYRALRQLSVDFKGLPLTSISSYHDKRKKIIPITGILRMLHGDFRSLSSHTHSYAGEKVLITLWHTLHAFNFHLGFCFSFFLFLICVQIICRLFWHFLRAFDAPFATFTPAVPQKVRIKSHLISSSRAQSLRHFLVLCLFIQLFGLVPKIASFCFCFPARLLRRF